MATTLGAADVLKIAALARLELTPDEVDLFARQLGDILAYADELRVIDTAGIAPTLHPLGEAPVWREDEPEPCLDRRVALEGAPDASVRTGLFKVPKVL